MHQISIEHTLEILGGEKEQGANSSCLSVTRFEKKPIPGKIKALSSFKTIKQ